MPGTYKINNDSKEKLCLYKIHNWTGKQKKLWKKSITRTKI